MSDEKKLIYADELLNDIRDDHNINGANFARIRRYIEAAPAVEAVQIVHGEWTVIDDCYPFDTIYQCSACKEEFVTIDGTPAENLWKYCPNCGAKMNRGEEDVQLTNRGLKDDFCEFLDCVNKEIRTNSLHSSCNKLKITKVL